NFQQTPEENMTQFMAGQRAARLWMLAITVLSYAGVLPVLAQEKSGSSAGKYNGPGSCSASSCHGGVQMVDENTRAQTRTHIWQNESFIWATQDPHFKAFSTLGSERSKQISRLLQRASLP